MFIVKVFSSESLPKWLRPEKAYHEVNTYEEAESIYRNFINEYPNSVNVKIFEIAHEVEMPKEILENALAEKNKRYEVMMKLRELGEDIHFEESDLDLLHESLVRKSIS